MGREIRRVPPGWEHPKRHNQWGYDFAPLYDKSYEEAQAAWEEARRTFNRTDYTFEEWEGDAPDPSYYRPAWDEDTRTAFQIYETVSEGTPVSPVFESEEDLVSCTGQGSLRDSKMLWGTMQTKTMPSVPARNSLQM